MIGTDVSALILKGAVQGLVIGFAMFASLYVQPATAVWMWPLTLLAFVTGGPSGKRRKR